MYRRTNYILALLIITVFIFSLKLEEPLFQTPHSTVLRDRDGNFLSGKISSDYQWRFPYNNRVPEKFKIAITQFEDKDFYSHQGVDPKALLRAAYQNIINKRVVSGASTISMQVIRLSRGKKKRNLTEKLIEAILAVKLEAKYSKEEILSLYSTYAPFGGNVVGLNSASWRYYKRDPYDISWSEAAALAVLPNSPGLIYPGRNEKPLLDKRNRLLKKLYDRGFIDKTAYDLSLQEALPGKPKVLPDYNRHLLNRAISEGYRGQNIVTTIDRELQLLSASVLNRHQSRLKENNIHNGAVLIADIDSGEILSYVGNSSLKGGENHSSSVDMIKAKRSPGSILKPILYALAIDDSLITPKGYLYDTPLYFKGYKPENYGYKFNGIMNADKSLQMSLNIPFVNLLMEYDYTRFYDKLYSMGLTFDRDPDHYGLTMILGGAEASLFDISSLYSSFVRSLNYYNKKGMLSDETFFPLSYIKRDIKIKPTDFAYISPGSTYSTLQAMTKLKRPDSLGNWESFSSSYDISWKTGTSTGFKDAWAIGLTKKYLVCVWVGNADGEGRSELVGVKSAAPLLFDIFKLLPKTDLPPAPVSDMEAKEICISSGYLKGPNCKELKTEYLPTSREYKICKFHKVIHLDENEAYQVKHPYPTYKMKNRSWLVFDPVTSWYYKNKNPGYIAPPPFLNESDDVMEFIYPKKSPIIYVPIELDGKRGGTIFEVAHREITTLYWHLDGEYIGKTEKFHQMMISPERGEHKITVVDSKGNEINRFFKIIK